MFRNFLKTSIRNIRRHKGFSFINILGLGLGLSSCLLIGLFVRDEKQYDALIPRGADVYRVYQKTKGDESNIIATAPPAFATALQENYPEVEQAVRVMSLSSKELFEANQKKLYEENGYVADSNFFSLFPLKFRFGSSFQVFNDPNSIVISSEMSERYFGRENPVGRDIRFQKSLFRIKAVMEKDQKFHLNINFIIPMAAAGLQGEMMKNWQWYPFNTYVQLKEGNDALALQRKFQDYSRPFLKGEGGINEPFFQPLAQIHLYSSDFKYDMSTRGNISLCKSTYDHRDFYFTDCLFQFCKPRNLHIAATCQGSGRKKDDRRRQKAADDAIHWRNHFFIVYQHGPCGCSHLPAASLIKPIHGKNTFSSIFLPTHSSPPR